MCTRSLSPSFTLSLTFSMNEAVDSQCRCITLDHNVGRIGWVVVVVGCQFDGSAAGSLVGASAGAGAGAGADSATGAGVASVCAAAACSLPCGN